MLFNSFEFLLFLSVFLCAWPLLRSRKNVRWAYLTVASFFFYGWWDWRFLFLIVASGLIDFLAGLGMERFSKCKRALLIASVIGNVGSLAVFKYLDFTLTNLNCLLLSLGVDRQIPLAGLTLPIGISFYTFQSMSYTIDVYSGKLKPTRNPLHFFAYLAMFPQLVAGPIVRAKDLLPQLETATGPTEQQRWEGLTLAVRGYFKKVVVADSFAPVVAAAFGSSVPLPSAAYWWGVTTLFAFQIYCDFSGYSDIARGIAKWMGYEFPVNFDNPYNASSTQDFWRRWHISLSSWFRDYVYVPLGGSRKGVVRGHLSMWTTMLLSGLWHGATWTFVLWGALHAFYVSVERITKWPKRISAVRGGKHLAALLTFVLVLVAWVVFRAESAGQALAVLSLMFDFTRPGFSEARSGINAECQVLGLLVVLWLVGSHLGLGTTVSAKLRGCRTLQALGVGALIAGCIFLRGPGSAFIYFQF